MLRSLQSTHSWKWPVVKDKHIKITRRICVLFVFDLDSECKFINNKIMVIKEKNRPMLLAAALRGWMDSRRFCFAEIATVENIFFNHRNVCFLISTNS